MLRLKQIVLAVPLLLSPLMGCSGSDGEDGMNGAVGPEGPAGPVGGAGQAGPPGDMGAPGAAGPSGAMGASGHSGLTVQTVLAMGDTHCFDGGIRFDSGADANGNGQLETTEIVSTSFLCAPTSVDASKNFNRIAVLPVCSQIDANCDDDTQTAAEIVAASADGMTLIYSDSPRKVVGFVDITDPRAPKAAGTLDLAGEPTSVAVVGNYALVGVNKSADFVNVSGELDVVDVTTKMSVRKIDLGGQPDSVAVSPDGKYAAVVIENERDEDLNDGAIPQLPAGKLVVVSLEGMPSAWTTRDVVLTGLAGIEVPTDPEPEFVDINSDNIAVVSLQENNGIVLVKLSDGSIVRSFSAGKVNLTGVDTRDDGIISLTETKMDVPREPDGVAWLSKDLFATADEGDLAGGSRGFTIFGTNGNVVYSSGREMDVMASRLGHYPDGRSDNKGNEPENVEFAVFGNDRYLFVNSERSSLVFVYDVADLRKPVFKQAVPAGIGPEGALAIPSRNLLVVASEDDSREDLVRSVINIYAYETAPAAYPTLISNDRLNGNPIPWAAMSGLAADPIHGNMLYAIEDSAFEANRIFAIDTGFRPARIVREIAIRDTNDVFKAVAAVDLADATVPANDATRKDVFDEADLAAMINPDKTVNIDPEGIAVAGDGGFWIASEGAGTVGEAARPVNTLNFLFKTNANGVIEKVVKLPDAINAKQIRFGYEGVSEHAGKVYVAFQRVWQGDANARIGIYDVASDTWTFAFYPLEAPASANGGWVGLSDISSLGDGSFLVVERDNQGGPDAVIKRLYRVTLAGLADGATVTKTLVRDLVPDLKRPGGPVYEKIEGSAVTRTGDVWIVNDNDGVDDNSGETQLINLGRLLP